MVLAKKNFTTHVLTGGFDEFTKRKTETRDGTVFMLKMSILTFKQ